GNQELITMIECICTDRTSLPPTYIFKGKNLQSSWIDSDPINANYAVSPSGWTDNELGVYWIEKMFDQETQDEADDARLLTLDGQTSHVSFEFGWYAREHSIDLLCLPLHSTAFLQPEDVVIFSLLAQVCTILLGMWTRLLISSIQGVYTICRLYARAQVQVFVPQLIQKAFEATGIFPFN
ncbi:hypothetical protein JAAARDRAFT_98391, partial [Jaapia argillacea MUCL 33604]